MVHLAAVRHDSDQEVIDALKNTQIGSPDNEDGAAVSVYGSRFAAECLPKHAMPEREMPKDVAYRMIKDELSLDGNPVLNLASFVTTYMEEEAEKLMAVSIVYVSDGIYI